MPLVRIHVSDAPAAEKAEALLSRAAEILAEGLDKPASYVMACLAPGATVTLGGESPACLIDVANIGILTLAKTKHLSADLCALVEERLGIPQAKTYVVFQDVERHRWGHDGKTFAG